MLALAVLGHGLVDPDLPVLAADDLGLTRGDGCFEGLRVQRTSRGPVIDALDAHLARLHRSAAALDLPVDEPAWRDLLAEVTEAWAIAQPTAQEASVKLMLTRGRPGDDTPTGMVSVTSIDPASLAARTDGVSVVTLRRGLPAAAFTGAPWLLGGVKTLSYAVNVAAQREARARGADDAIFLADDGSLLEATTASVVWIVDRVLVTVAPGDNGILRGTTQEVLFAAAPTAGWEVSASSGTVADLRAASAVLLVSAVRGPVPVTSVDGVALTVDGTLVREVQELAGF